MEEARTLKMQGRTLKMAFLSTVHIHATQEMEDAAKKATKKMEIEGLKSALKKAEFIERSQKRVSRDGFAGNARQRLARLASHFSSNTVLFFRTVKIWCLFGFVSFVTSVDGKEPQMGSRGQHPACRVEDYFVRPSSTLGPLGKRAQSISRQSQEGVVKWKDTVGHNDQFVKVHQMCMRQLTSRSQGCRLQTARWTMLKSLQPAQAQAVVPPVSE